MNLLDATMFKAMMTNGYLDLKKHLQEVNDLNVFPVPDGDTGSNMGATMQGGVDTFDGQNLDSVGEVAMKMAKGMLLSARGNSGVILSQFFAGLASGLAGHDQVNLITFAQAMEMGVKKAYSVVVKPVEGTILTVMREGCDAALAQINSSSTFEDYFTTLVAKMRESLQKTPELLSVLKDAGVIDSGGAGLVYIIEGMGQAIGGKIIEDVSLHLSSSGAKGIDLSAFSSSSKLDYGYCTEFILQLTDEKDGPKNFVLKDLISYYETLGNSIVALQNGTLVKVHVHTKTPDKAIAYAQKYGEFLTFKMDNMALQHNETVVAKSSERALMSAPAKKKHSAMAIVACSPNEKTASVLKDYGANEVLIGGEQMELNPQDFVEGFRKANADALFVFPNSKQEILVAKQAAEFVSESTIHIIETVDVAQGLAAISSMDLADLSEQENLEAAERGLEETASLKVGKATKASQIGEEKVEIGDYVGLINGKLACKGENVETCLKKLVSLVPDAEDKEQLVVLLGEGLYQEKTEAKLEEALPDLELHFLDGGQKIFDVIGLLS